MLPLGRGKQDNGVGIAWNERPGPPDSPTPQMKLKDKDSQAYAGRVSAPKLGGKGTGEDPSREWTEQFSPWLPERSYEAWTGPEDFQPMVRMAGLLLANGCTFYKADAMLGFPTNTTKLWWTNPAFRQFVKDNEGKHEEVVISALLVGEQRAANTLLELLDSKDDDIRLKAAVSLLDRAGNRGAPRKGLDIKALSVTGDAATLIRQALLDPGVRARFREIPGIADLIASEATHAEARALPVPDHQGELQRDDPQWETIPEGVQLPSDGHGPLPRVLHHPPEDPAVPPDRLPPQKE